MFSFQSVALASYSYKVPPTFRFSFQALVVAPLGVSLL